MSARSSALGQEGCEGGVKYDNVCPSRWSYKTKCQASKAWHSRWALSWPALISTASHPRQVCSPHKHFKLLPSPVQGMLFPLRLRNVIFDVSNAQGVKIVR